MENMYLSTLVRIHDDRKQHVISTGVYGFVRHSLYLGCLLMMIGAPLLLEWNAFHALLPIDLDFESMEALCANPALRYIKALLLVESGYDLIIPYTPPAGRHRKICYTAWRS